MNSKVTHSVMFHHFHGGSHLPSQGSISADQFANMIDFLSKHFNLIGANEYFEKFRLGSLNKSDICLSFDDALKCQYDIAVPVLNQYQLDVFFFVYTSIFTNKPDLLELYRYFRCNFWEDMNDFNNKFEKQIFENKNDCLLKHKIKFRESNYLAERDFYTEEDRWFRYLRDCYLDPKRYHSIMNEMMVAMNFNYRKHFSCLWMSEADLQRLDEMGHVIGLHTFSHPTKISIMEKDQQRLEYKKNYDDLRKLTGSDINVMSHPCGDYNQDTLAVLKELKIEMGFRADMSIERIISPFEIPRRDHADLLRDLNL